MRGTIETEVHGAIAEVLPLACSSWTTRAAKLAAERLTPILQAEALLQGASSDRVSIPVDVAEKWAARAVDVFANVEAAIEGAIGVDDDMLGDLIETLDLVSRHARETIAEMTRHASRCPSAFVQHASATS